MVMLMISTLWNAVKQEKACLLLGYVRASNLVEVYWIAEATGNTVSCGPDTVYKLC